MADIEFGKDVLYIGGAGYSFNRLQFETANVRRATARIVADVHTYAQEYFPEGSGLSMNTWLIAGSQIKYRIFVNGQLMGIGPARPVKDQAYMHEFDLTEALVSGENAIGVVSLGESRGFAMAVEIEHVDGSASTFITDSTWKSLPGGDVFRPVCWEHPGVDCLRNNSMGPGELPEHIDGRLFPSGWSEVGFDDSSWHQAKIHGKADGKYAEPDIANLVTREIHPEKTVKLADGHFFFDFGKEVIAGIALNVPSAKESFALRLGEECWAPNRVRYMLRTGNYYEEIWTPAENPVVLEHFGLRAFRFGEVFGWTGELNPKDITARVVHYPFDDEAACFESPDKVLNDVWDFCKYSIKATNVDIYQDCPTRERHSYEGDSYINMLCHYALDPDPRLARHNAEFLIYHPTWPAEWVMVMVNIFWADYMQTGDLSMIRKYYERLRDVCSFHGVLEDGLRTEFPTKVIVDWPQSQRDGYDFGPVNSVANAYLYKDVVLLSRMAAELGRDEESDALKELSSTVMEAFNRRLFDESQGLYVDHEGSSHASFHANMFPLSFGLVPDDRKKRVVEFLKAKGMTCSVYGAQFFLDALYANGESEYALGLMTATTGNSWGHMIYERDATITTESWDPDQKSNMSWAHPWAASPANIIPRRFFGIRPAEPGWKKFRIDPQPGGLPWAKIKVPTPAGSITASFENIGADVRLSFTVPDGCKALVGGKEYAGDAKVILKIR